MEQEAEEIKMISVGNSDRLKLLKNIGYDVDDEGYVFNKKTGEQIKCRYGKDKVHIDTAGVLPGSIIMINTNPITLAEYFVEFSE